MQTQGRRLGLARSLLLMFSGQLLWFPCHRNTTHLVLCHSRHWFIVSRVYPYLCRSHLLSIRDLWVADTNCDIGCSADSPYNSASSSTFQNLSEPFSITYGSGQAAGDLVADVVQMAGFSVNNQTFGSVTQVSQGLLSSPVSGLLGLGWQTIASSSAPPFWQTLASKGAFTQPVMGFQLTRYVLRLIYVERTYSVIISFLNDSSARPLEPGGSFTMGALGFIRTRRDLLTPYCVGFLNSSLWTGSIDYQNLVTTPSFWVLSLNSQHLLLFRSDVIAKYGPAELTVQGYSVSLPSGSGSYAAIDTGTTLVGGPSSVMQNVYAQIPGSQAGSGNWKGYWTYRTFFMHR